ncbi:MAG: hypothetical protein WAN38_10945 [Terriglobales bacterium]
MKNRTTRWVEWTRSALLALALATTASAVAQTAANRLEPPPLASARGDDPSSDSMRELREQVRELHEAIDELRSDWQRARAETSDLRRELDEVRAGTAPRNAVLKRAVVRLETRNPASAAVLPANSAASFLQNAAPVAQEEVEKEQRQDDSQNEKLDSKKAERAATLEEEYQLLIGKVDDQYQTKVESGSKYRLRLSGIVLMNLVSNQGVVDAIDLPQVAYGRQPGDSGGSFGATLRQSEIGFETFGPTVAGAKTSANLQVDFGGGFATIPNGFNSGLLRLRTATLRMDWPNTALVVGQDALFFSPNSPTSFASLAIPALSWSGNLWSWVPQIRVEHRVDLGNESSLLFQGGILDPVNGEIPGASYYRGPGAGESSRQPAVGSRIAWTRQILGQPLRLGAAGFYSRQDYGFGQNVDSWAAMSDIEIPLSSRLSLSGKLYRGRALGGLNGGIGTSAVFSGPPATAGTEVRGLNSVGGWTQLRYRPANKWELNAAYGMDNPYASDLKYFPYSQPYNTSLARNLGSFANLIYRPRSDLLFSAEYRHLTTYMTAGEGNSAGQLNLMMGVLF